MNHKEHCAEEEFEIKYKAPVSRPTTAKRTVYTMLWQTMKVGESTFLNIDTVRVKKSALGYAKRRNLKFITWRERQGLMIFRYE